MTKKIEGLAEIEDLPDGGKKIVFAPGCFDNFDGTQEELDEAIAMITDMLVSDEPPEGMEVRQLDLDELLETDPELAEKLLQSIADIENDDPNKRKLQ
jgi:hypothetical protein